MDYTSCFSDLPVGVEAEEFIRVLDERLDQILQAAVKQNVTDQPWDTIEKQLQACYFNAWGEIRSADTFARQIRAMGSHFPVLKARVAKQLHDEMRHYFMYQDCAYKMGGVEVTSTPPVEPFLKMFDYCDEVSDDPREMVFTCQFNTEKFAIFLFKESMSKLSLHEEFQKALEQILPDEYFHVSNGRTAGLMLAREGVKARERLLELAARTLAFTAGAIQGSGEQIRELGLGAIGKG
jgi:hypothetical protein